MVAYRSSRAAPRQKRSQETVRLILVAAAKLFEARGFGEVTTNDIAKEAAIPVGLVYRYFHDKDAIIQAVIATHLEEILRLFRDLRDDNRLTTLSWYEIEVRILHTFNTYMREHGTRAYFHYYMSDPSLGTAMLPDRRNIWHAYTELIARRSGRSVKDSTVLEVATVTLSMISGIILFDRNLDQPDGASDRIMKRGAEAIGTYIEAEFGNQT